jgi:hypothetical protein
MKNDNININSCKQAWRVKPDGRSSEEIYKPIVDDISKMYNGKLSEVETHEAARNMIEFVKIFMEVHVRLEKEKNNKT